MKNEDMEIKEKIKNYLNSKENNLIKLYLIFDLFDLQKSSLLSTLEKELKEKLEPPTKGKDPYHEAYSDGIKMSLKIVRRILK